MGSFTIGSVVLISFPYADFSKFKKRPALVVGKAEFNNLILCQITSKADTSKTAVQLNDVDFVNGSLNLTSYVRPDKLFTIEQSVIEEKIGLLADSKIKLVRLNISKLFS
jgi:mRNA interferase MazF